MQPGDAQHCHAVVGVKLDDAVSTHLRNIQVRECRRKIAGHMRRNVVQCLRGDVSRCLCRDGACINLDFVYSRLEVVDDVVAVMLTKDKRVSAELGVASTHRLEIAPHVIRGIGSADEAISSTTSTATSVNKIADEGVAAAYSAYEGIVPAVGGAQRRIGIADERVDRVRSAYESVVSPIASVTHDRFGIAVDGVGTVRSARDGVVPSLAGAEGIACVAVDEVVLAFYSIQDVVSAGSYYRRICYDFILHVASDTRVTSADA